jgi:hypothetical protein
MPAYMFKVVNMEVWGNIVKTWATGVDHVGDGSNYTVLPKDIPELVAQLNRAGAGAEMPDSYKELQIVQSTATKLVIRIPDKAALEAAEADLTNNPNATMDVPEYYKIEFGAHDLDPATPVAHKLLVQAMVIGDYTIRHCK